MATNTALALAGQKEHRYIVCSGSEVRVNIVVPSPQSAVPPFCTLHIVLRAPDNRRDRIHDAETGFVPQ